MRTQKTAPCMVREALPCCARFAKNLLQICSQSCRLIRTSKFFMSTSCSTIFCDDILQGPAVEQGFAKKPREGSRPHSGTSDRKGVECACAGVAKTVRAPEGVKILMTNSVETRLARTQARNPRPTGPNQRLAAAHRCARRYTLMRSAPHL